MVTFLPMCAEIPVRTTVANEFGCLDRIHMDTVCSHREDKAKCVTLNSATTYAVSAEIGRYWLLVSVIIFL